MTPKNIQIYNGLAHRMRSPKDGNSIIVIAETMEELAVAFQKIHPDAPTPFRKEFVERVTVLSAKELVNIV